MRIQFLPAYLVFLLTALFTSASGGAANETKIAYNLAISFDIDKKTLHGTAHLILAEGETLTIFCHGIETTGIVLQNHHTPPSVIRGCEAHQLNIPASKDQQELFISYRKTVADGTDNHIGSDGITLINNWHPQPSKDVLFSLSAAIPRGFKAISESDHLLTGNSTSPVFSFSHPLENLNFIAAPFSVASMEVRPGLEVYTFLRAEERELSEKYLLSAAAYLRYYEHTIGAYPYNHFAVVENIQPTGYGMPTFTLLGGKVLRLPFILETSLGHEILHSWFGNGVRVAEDSGNWSEGLTTYLADWAYQEEKGNGSVTRKEGLLKYLSFVSEENSIPLQDFRSAGHNQPQAEAIRSIGYNKGAMLFHELKNRLGSDLFNDGIRSFYHQFRGKKASWLDIRDVFEKVSNQPLKIFFEQKLTRTDIADLEVEDIHLDSSSGSFRLSLMLTQKSAPPYNLLVPLRITTSAGERDLTETMDTGQKEVVITLESSPLAVTIDPDYDLWRKPAPEEAVPTWSKLLGTAGATVIVAADDREKFAPLLALFSRKGMTIVDAGETNESSIERENLIFLGLDNPLSRSLFALPKHPEKGLTLDVRNHPLNREKTILLVSCSDGEELEKAMRLLPHYGKYSFLHFLAGKNMEKTVAAAAMGRRYTIDSPPLAVSATTLLPFARIIAELADARAIYVGETHTSMADHNLQLQVIEGLFHQGRELAVGLEMFPRSSQQALDDYIFGDGMVDERDFLKQSKYFQVWGYDYRYYRAIINFAKKHAIPLVALNIDRSIVNAVFRSGSTGTLSEPEVAQIPLDRDLDLPNYSRRLSTVHGYHRQGTDSGGDFPGFIQAQAIWDETMAANIAEYLQAHPRTRMVILAGAQHTRNDSGIPPRVQRRLDVPQRSLLNAGSLSHPTPLPSDYYLFLNEDDLPATGRIGIGLEETTAAESTFVQITDLSPQGKAKEAGLLKGDILISINGYPITAMEDVRIAMVDGRPGDIIPVQIRRTDKVLQPREMQFTIELYEHNEESR